MQFGLFGAATAQRGGPDVDSAAGFKDYIEYLIEAEALGFHSSFIVEHHFTGFGQVSATLNLLTWIGASTRTLRLGTAVIVLPWHNPVLLAEQAATIDLLSGGRLDFGIGKGYRHNEFAGFRIPMEEAEPRFEEAIDIITKSWTSNERFSFRGKYWQFDDIIVEPPTNQKPHPPFWQGAGHPEFDRAGWRSAVTICWWTSSARSKPRRSASRSIRRKWRRTVSTTTPRWPAWRVRSTWRATAADKEAAIDRRLAAQQRLTAISQRPDGNNTASIMAFSDTRAASEASAHVRQSGRHRAQAGDVARPGRGICAAERRRHLARQSAPVRARGDARVPHRTTIPRGGVGVIASRPPAGGGPTRPE